MKSSTKRAAAIVPAALLIAMGIHAPVSAVAHWKQGFESDATGWFENSSDARIQRVASGTDGIASSSGANHAVLTGPGMYTKFGAYDAEWDGTWTAEVDVYLDPKWEAGTGFDYSVAANGSDDKHQRDFVFHVTKDSSEGELLVGASNNSSFSPRENLEELPNHAVVTDAGWYTLRHTFRDQGGVLAVDLELVKDGKVLFTETRSDAADIMAAIGGNRYGWFTALSGTQLAIDDVEIGRPDQEPGRDYRTDFTHVAITKANEARWRMSGGYDAGIATTGGDARLRLSNATTSGSFGDMLFSPQLAVAAEEGDVDNAFNASFVVEPTEYQEGLSVTVSPDDGQGGRNGWLRLTHVDGGLTVEVAGSYFDENGEQQWQYVDVAKGLDVTTPHTVNMSVIKVPSITEDEINDVFRASVDEGTAVEVGTFEAYYAANHEANHATDTLLFRLSGAAAPALKGMEIDDLSMWVSTEDLSEAPAPPTDDPGPSAPPSGTPVTPSTPPTTTPPTTAPVTPSVTPAVPTVSATAAKVAAESRSGRTKMHVNVNPNKGSGYWNVRIQKKTSKGWKYVGRTYRTQGKYETLTLNLSKGTYRAVVMPKYGRAKGYSKSVTLRK